MKLDTEENEEEDLFGDLDDDNGNNYSNDNDGGESGDEGNLYGDLDIGGQTNLTKDGITRSANAAISMLEGTLTSEDDALLKANRKRAQLSALLMKINVLGHKNRSDGLKKTNNIQQMREIFSNAYSNF